MTLDGTNTWLIAEPGSAAAIVIDPGPEDEGHLLRVRDLVASAGQRVALIVLTHRHADHSAGAARFAELTGAPVRAVDPEQRLGDEGLAAGDVLDRGRLRAAGAGHARPLVRLRLPRAARRRRRADRRHRARPRHHGDRRGRQPDGLPGLAAAAARAGRARPTCGCCCPATARCWPGPRRPWTTTWPTGPSGWPRCGPRWTAGDTDPGPDRRAGLRRRARRTCGRRAGVGPRPARLPGRAGPGAARRDLVGRAGLVASWPACAAGRCRPAAPTWPTAGSSRGRRSRPGPC